MVNFFFQTPLYAIYFNKFCLSFSLLLFLHSTYMYICIIISYYYNYNHYLQFYFLPYVNHMRHEFKTDRTYLSFLWMESLPWDTQATQIYIHNICIYNCGRSFDVVVRLHQILIDITEKPTTASRILFCQHSQM